MRIAPSGRFSREAREPDQHHRSIWLLASRIVPTCRIAKTWGVWGACQSYLSVYLGPRHVWTLCP